MITDTINQRKKILKGVVKSNKMDKTVVVAVTQRVIDPDYKKYYRKTTKYFAHDEKNECTEGDMVEIIQSRPLSKNKFWRLLKIVRKVQ
jgi:small subunit ribosomal protein S17